MVRIFIFILAALFYGCSDEQPNKCEMILSDSLPIQFWPIGDTTFNDQVICDIDRYPFYYEPNCNKDIKLKWSTSTDEGEFALAVYDGEGEFVTRLFFTKTFISPFYVYQLIFTPTSIEMCGECFRVEIEAIEETEDYEEVLENTEFIGSMSPWVTSDRGHGCPWAWTPSYMELFVSVPPPGEIANESDLLVQPFEMSQPGNYRINLGIRQEVFLQVPVYIRIYIDNSTDGSLPTLIHTFNTTIPSTIPYELYTQDVEIPIEFDRYWLQINTISGDAFLDLDGSARMFIELFSLEQQVAVYTPLYKSEIIKPSTDTDCSVEINYKTYKYFEGIVPVSGETYFTIFIPGRFFHERNKVEQKSIDLSNSRVINTASGLKKQKLLEIYDVPYYMHTKLQLILQYAISGSLLINGVEWTIEEDYAFQGDRPSTYPQQAAQVYLTRRNFLVHNVI